MAMRVHITLEERLVRELDRRVGARRRSAYIATAVQRALDDDHRWELIESALGGISDRGHEWDDDAARWVHEQRRSDERRIG
jgi:metal-responsive CopG/Arc/MetJ family transcriptional regulator